MSTKKEQWVKQSRLDTLREVLEEIKEEKISPQPKEWGTAVPRWELFNNGVDSVCSLINQLIKETEVPITKEDKEK